MSLFNKKHKVGITSFSFKYYEDNFFNLNSKNSNLIDLYDSFLLEKIHEADITFETCAKKLQEQMLAIKLETFAIALLHHFGDKLSIQNSAFTKSYLNEKNQNYIWENIQPYNLSVARSASENLNNSKLFSLNKARVELYKKYYKTSYDKNCIARVVNRIATKVSWQKTITPNFLSLQLAQQLDCNLNKEAIFTITAFIIGIYKGAEEAFSKIKIIND